MTYYVALGVLYRSTGEVLEVRQQQQCCIELFAFFDHC